MTQHLSAITSRQRRWWLLAIFSLALSGVGPLVLIAGRASFMAEWQAVQEWFLPMLVVHVNLSVLTWFLAACALAWSMRALKETPLTMLVGQFAQGSYLLGLLAVAAAPLAGGPVYISNYIPVQYNGLFFIGLGFLLAGMLLALGQWALARSRQHPAPLFHIAADGAVLIIVAALLAFYLSFLLMPEGIAGEQYFERLWWAGGHLFLFAPTLLMTWWWLETAYTLEIICPASWHRQLLRLYTIGAVAGFAAFAFWGVNDYMFIRWFTWHMNIWMGTLPAALGAVLLLRMRWRHFHADALMLACLKMSIVLFLIGGLIGALIEGSNTIIPAHYHGSIVAVTVAFMGWCYQLGRQWHALEPSLLRHAWMQPSLLGIGQMMHVAGLAWAGGHGVQRKTVGALEQVDMGAELALHLMRWGGLLAVLGGVWFIVNMVRILRRPRTV